LAQDALRYGIRRRLLKRGAHKGGGPGKIMSKSQFKHRLFISKRGIEARRLDAHRRGKIMDRSAFISLSPKDMHGSSIDFTIRSVNTWNYEEESAASCP
jgi:hypothetical protein